MPEVFAVLLVFAGAIFVYVMMWLQSRDPALYKPQAELARMRQQMVWLKERQEVARGENWDAGLKASLGVQLEETAQQMVDVEALLAGGVADGERPLADGAR